MTKLKKEYIIKWTSTVNDTISAMNDLLRNNGFHHGFVIIGRAENGHIVQLKYCKNDTSMFEQSVYDRLTDNSDVPIMEFIPMQREILKDEIDEIASDLMSDFENGGVDG